MLSANSTGKTYADTEEKSGFGVQKVMLTLLSAAHQPIRSRGPGHHALSSLFCCQHDTLLMVMFAMRNV